MRLPPKVVQALETIAYYINQTDMKKLMKEFENRKFPVDQTPVVKEIGLGLSNDDGK